MKGRGRGKRKDGRGEIARDKMKGIRGRKEGMCVLACRKLHGRGTGSETRCWYE